MDTLNAMKHDLSGVFVLFPFQQQKFLAQPLAEHPLATRGVDNFFVVFLRLYVGADNDLAECGYHTNRDQGCDVQERQTGGGIRKNFAQCLTIQWFMKYFRLSQ